MIENRPNPSEIGAEHILSGEEVHLAFRELINKEYTETRKLEDENGLYLLEVEVPGDTEGEVYEYAYMRKGHHDTGGVTSTDIHVTYYKDGIPTGGDTIARYRDGKWDVRIDKEWNDPQYKK